MNCPHCNQEIADELVKSAAAQLAGRKSKRVLTPEQAREMAEKSAEAWRKSGKKAKRQLTPEQAREMAEKSAETRRRNKEAKKLL